MRISLEERKINCWMKDTMNDIKYELVELYLD